MRNRLAAPLACLSLFVCTLSAAAAPTEGRVAPDPNERQLPDKMHSAMSDLPAITVGQADADIVGKDNRALQAAVDYVANLGGGVVNIGPGEYVMRDSLHLRSHVTVRGTAGKTILRKADGAASPLAMDGDYGEEQITVKDPTGFQVGHGVTVWDTQSGGFHTTVARITGRRGNTFSVSKPLNADCMMSNKAMAATVFGSTLFLLRDETRFGGPSALIASGPFDDGPGWEAVPEGSLVEATASRIEIQPL